MTVDGIKVVDENELQGNTGAVEAKELSFVLNLFCEEINYSDGRGVSGQRDVEGKVIVGEVGKQV